jgi:hypothetical protein
MVPNAAFPRSVSAPFVAVIVPSSAIRNLNRVAEEEERVEHVFAFVDGHRVVRTLGMALSQRMPSLDV